MNGGYCTDGQLLSEYQCQENATKSLRERLNSEIETTASINLTSQSRGRRVFVFFRNIFDDRLTIGGTTGLSRNPNRVISRKNTIARVNFTKTVMTVCVDLSGDLIVLPLENDRSKSQRCSVGISNGPLNGYFS